MASEEPIRIDASTVHRATQQGNESDAETGSVRESGAGSSLTEGASEGVEQITEANTVSGVPLAWRNHGLLPASLIVRQLQSQKVCWEQS